MKLKDVGVLLPYALLILIYISWNVINRISKPVIEEPGFNERFVYAWMIIIPVIAFIWLISDYKNFASLKRYGILFSAKMLEVIPSILLFLYILSEGLANWFNILIILTAFILFIVGKKIEESAN